MKEFITTFSEQVDKIFPAFAEAMPKFKMPEKSGNNTHFKNRYSTLADIYNAIMEPLLANGMFPVQTLGYRDGVSVVITHLCHKSGQWIRSEGLILAAKPDAQSLGSAITYMRRYSLSSIVGVGREDFDDDGEEATRPPQLVVKLKPQVVAKPAADIKGLLTSVQKKGLNAQQVEGYIESLAEKYGKSVDEVVTSVLDPVRFDKFCVGYAKMLDQQSVSI